MSLNPRRHEGVPPDRLGRIAEAASDALAAHPEHVEGDRCIVLVNNPVQKTGTVHTHGYDTDEDAFRNLLIHARALAEANGVELLVVDP